MGLNIKEKIGYIYLITTAKLLSVMPNRCIYFISDIIFFTLYRVVRYRRKVVADNLRRSFPEKSDLERSVIERKYYKSMGDLFVETLYMRYISEEEMRERCKFINVEILDPYLDSGRPIFATLGHYCNWEWLSSLPLFSDLDQYSIYKPLRSKASDRFYREARSRFGATVVPKSNLLRALVKGVKESDRLIVGFINDQTPKPKDIQHSVNFLNQKTPVLLGCEKLALSFDAVVVYASMRRVKRGYYELEFIPITDSAKLEDQYYITDRSIELLEIDINRDPECWLWSHRRWKYALK